MELTKQTLKQIRQDLQNAIDAAQIQGLTIEIGSCRFDAAQADFKLSVTVQGAKTQDQKFFDLMANAQGLDQNKVAHITGKACNLTGYNSRARKMPWIITEQSTGKQYKISDQQAVIYFAA
jgi:hypothetical protein